MDIEEFRKCFGENLKNLRKNKGLTQSELAESIGLETHNLNRIENGKSFPQVKTLINIINYFNILPYGLFTNKNDKIASIVGVLNKNPEKLDDFSKILNALTSKNE